MRWSFLGKQCGVLNCNHGATDLFRSKICVHVPFFFLQISWGNKILSIAGHTKDPTETVIGFHMFHFHNFFLYFLCLLSLILSGAVFYAFNDSEGIRSADLYLVELKDIWEATGNRCLEIFSFTLKNSISQSNRNLIGHAEPIPFIFFFTYMASNHIILTSYIIV